MIRRVVLWSVVGLVVLIVAGVAWVGVRGFLAYRHLEAARGLVTKIDTEAVHDKNVDAARVDVMSLQRQADAARSLTGDPIWRAAEVVPWAGSDLRVVRQLSAALAATADDAATPLITLATEIDPSQFTPKAGTLDLKPLIAAQPAAARADAALRHAVASLAGIDTSGTVAPLRKAATQTIAQLTTTSRQVAILDRAAQLLPPMLGAQGPRDYLLVTLNNAELRSHGGIVGSLALVRADHGKITIERQASDSEFDHFPKPVTRLGPETAALWTTNVGRYIQDTSSVPQFDTAAKLMVAMWHTRYHGKIDGVVSVDPVALSYLLGATGPVTVPGGFTLTSDNAVRFLLSEVYAKIPSPTLEDRFFEGTAAAIFAKIADGSFDPRTMLSALAKAGDERRINIWSAAPSEQAQLAPTTLAGGLPASTSADKVFGVYVDDATGAKLDYYLKSSIGAAALRCTAASGRAVYRVQVTMTNGAPLNAATSLPRYVTAAGVFGVSPGYLQTDVAVYAPPGLSVLNGRVSGQGIAAHTLYMQSAHDDGRSVGKYRILLAPGQTKTVTMDFTAASSFAGTVSTQVTPMVNAPAAARVSQTCGVKEQAAD